MTASSQNSFFVSTEWLAENLDAPDVAVIHGTHFLPGGKRPSKAGYLAGHITGPVFFRIDATAEHTTNLPHMLPRPSSFAQAMEKLGLGDGMRFVVYDASNLVGGARVWWTLRVFGARDVKILAGGLPRWRAEGRPLEQGLVRRMPRPFTVDFDRASVAGAEAVKRASEAGSAQILDARAAARVAGSAARPRPGVV